MTVRIVVGGDGFVGRAIVRRLQAEPGRLIVVDQHVGVRAAGAEVVEIDCRSSQFVPFVRRWLTGAVRAELFVAAGVVGDLTHAGDMSLDRFRSDIAANLDPAFVAGNVFAREAAGCGVTGSMTLLSSLGASRAHRYKIAYDAAKAGVESLARGFALEYAAHGITTRAVQVGPIADSASSTADGASAATLIRLVPRGRYATVEEIADAIVAFAGPGFDVATGAVLPLDGGLLHQLRPADVERAPDAHCGQEATMPDG